MFLHKEDNHVPVSGIKYFLISVTLKGGAIHQGVRSLEYGDIDHAWVLYKSKAEQKWGIQIIDYSCVQLSRHSEQVKQLQATKPVSKRNKG